MARRHRSTSNVSSNNAHDTRPQRTESPTPTQQPKRQLGMSPAIYENNMKVLLRREPSITSIFDQFSHVCLYHYNGSKWEKQGYEGSMFLFEKRTHPPYGFFILNRMGTDDYIRPIHPEDDMDIIGDYLMYRFYPEFTKTRIGMGLSYPIPAELRAAFDEELMKRIPAEQLAASKPDPTKEWKGNSVTIGLWMFATDAREPLKDVMMRLHSYIKQGKPYPDQFRYGPGRPPPPNPHLRTASRASVASQDEEQTPHLGSYQSLSRSTSRQEHAMRQQVSNVINGTEAGASQPATNVAGSDLDKLFAKLIPSASQAPSTETQHAVSGSTSTMSVQDLFTALGGHELAQTRAPSASPASVPTSSRGLALLDSIFASAAPPPPPAAEFDPNNNFTLHAPPFTHTNYLPPHPENIQIVSPKPTSSTLPQILNQDVISSLLGLGPGSRASSAAPSSADSRRSGHNRYEGDNEYSDGELVSESDYSASSTVLDADADPAVLAAGSSSGLPLFAIQTATSNSYSEGTVRGSRGVEGDVTPRATVRGIGPLSPPLPDGSATRNGTQQYLAPSSFSTSGAHHLDGDTGDASTSTMPSTNPPRRSRPLVPFEADSDLWPYPRAPLDDRSLEQDDVDVVELDFADTRALSDPAMFSSRLKEKQSKAGGKKKTRKERAADREREKEEIERSWDDPVRGQVQAIGSAHQSVAPVVPAVNGKGKHAAVNSTSINGDHPHESGSLQVKVARDAVISAVLAQPTRPSKDVSRNDFVRELLTLIHTNKAFVDNLWQEYTGRAG
ncbi:hypothetical protein AcW1_001534 [Taiwanofungus camphoratus]|nr:hypothetical protein AcV5_000427 [Antrodia cinnamomea]KAI0945279.1 hypothetical protein AcW1_001534 [Antrodia cinnamomea]